MSKIVVIIKSITGYTWAVLCLVVVLITFMGLGMGVPEGFARVTGIRVSPWFSGGEVARTIDHGSYQTLIRRPVFDGLFSERAEGFVQVDWVPNKGQTLPVLIEEELDINADGINDFLVRLETGTNKVALTRFQPWVSDLDTIVTADGERIIRVKLHNFKAK